MKKVIEHILCSVLLMALGIYVLVSWPHETLPLLIGVALAVSAIIVAVPTPLHEVVVFVSKDGPLFSSGITGLFRLGRRETDPVIVTPPPTEPATGDKP